MGILDAIFSAAFEGDGFNPVMGTSTNYKHWISVEDWKRCIECAKNHGKIWLMAQQPYPEPPIHPHCRCMIESMQSITAGTATINGVNGADWTLKYNGKLPDYYISSYEASLVVGNMESGHQILFREKPLQLVFIKIRWPFTTSTGTHMV